MSGILIYNQPHLMNKILYEFKGLCSKTALCIKKDCRRTEIIINRREKYYDTIMNIIFSVDIYFNNSVFHFWNCESDEGNQTQVINKNKDLSIKKYINDNNYELRDIKTKRFLKYENKMLLDFVLNIENEIEENIENNDMEQLWENEEEMEKILNGKIYYNSFLDKWIDEN